MIYYFHKSGIEPFAEELSDYYLVSEDYSDRLTHFVKLTEEQKAFYEENKTVNDEEGKKLSSAEVYNMKLNR